MREITRHHTNECNRAITVDVLEDDKGEPHLYNVSWDHPECEPDTDQVVVELPFQHGPIKEAGVNGITNEVLLAIVIDRLEFFQKGKFANVYNGSALSHIVDALEILEQRTREREARGVEGTHKL